jgi:hypothetical protein
MPINDRDLMGGQKAFLAPANTVPEGCPEGHPREVEDDFAGAD